MDLPYWNLTFKTRKEKLILARFLQSGSVAGDDVAQLLASKRGDACQCRLVVLEIRREFVSAFA